MANTRNSQDQMQEEVAKKEERRVRARKSPGQSVWFGLGMFGLIGWSIAIPTIIGIAIGVWIDRTWKPGYSCTLMCLFVGVVMGCWIAWYWIQQEVFASEQADHDEQDGRK